MNLDLIGKKVLVTGSTAGIGFAIAKSLFNEGASVIINGRTEKRVSEAMEAISGSASDRMEGVIADLSSEEGIDIISKKISEVDILINNFGVYEAKDPSALTGQDFKRMFDLNVISGAQLSLHYLPKMKAKNWGRIIFISSETGIFTPADMLHYGVSKSAQIALARGLAETTRGTGVTVNSILPGPTYSEGVDRFLKDVIKDSEGEPEQIKKEFIQKLRPTSLLERFATADEVANLVAYVSSPLSSATNGASLRVEGGLLRNAF